MGLERGDIVVTTPYTFAASAQVVQHLGAIPVFVDVSPSTLNIDVYLLEACLERLAKGASTVLPRALRHGRRPRAAKVVLPVHLGGIPCDLGAIYKLASAYGTSVVEDAAHAFPTSLDGRPVGTATEPSVPAAVCFSFYATKTITTGEGGMLTTHVPEIADRARLMSLHGMSHDAWGRYAAQGSWRYEIVAPGYKYNLTDYAAALGLVQLRRAESMTARRVEIARRYDEAFAGRPALEVPTVPPGSDPSWHLYPLRLNVDGFDIRRDRFIAAMTTAGIGTSVHFVPLHLHRYYRETYGYEPEDFPVARRESEREVSLPIYSRMSDDDVTRVIEAVLTAACEAGHR
jgi:perosamine synthetase